MKNYLKLKSDIQGYKDVRETVKTVEKIAASSIHDLKIKVKSLLQYKEAIENALGRLSAFDIKNTSPLLRAGKGEKWLVVIGGDKGLVGGLHHNLVNACLEKAKEYQKIVVIGKKINDFLEDVGLRAEKVFSEFSEAPLAESINTCTEYLFTAFLQKKCAAVDILYPGFISLSEQNPAILPFLPFNFKQQSSKAAPQGTPAQNTTGLPIFEPSKQTIFDTLLRRYINVYFSEIMMEAKLSEFSARTISMEHAASKTGKFISKMKLTYNKERRKSVTQKQLESFIVHKIV